MAGFLLSKRKASSKCPSVQVFDRLFLEVRIPSPATQRVENRGRATRSARPLVPTAAPEASGLAGSERDLPDASCSEHCGESGPQIALEHDRDTVHGAAAAERLLELAAPRLERGRG